MLGLKIVAGAQENFELPPEIKRERWSDMEPRTMSGFFFFLIF